MKTVSRSISSSVGFILRGRRPFRKRRCRSKREREPCRTCAARARGFESKTAIAIVVVYSRTTYVSYILNIRVRAHVVRSGISSKRKGKILVLGSFLFANSLHLPPLGHSYEAQKRTTSREFPVISRETRADRHHENVASGPRALGMRCATSQ